MRLPHFAIQNYLFILVLVSLSIFIGLRTYQTMPRAEDPFLSLPNYTVIAIYPGTSPEDMEELVVDPIEEVIDELDDIDEIRTDITNGLAVIKVQGLYGRDYDEKYDEILAEVNNIRGELPEGLYDLEVSQYKPEDRVVVHQFALVSESADYPELYDLAEAFQDRLEVIPFVKEVEIEASPQEEVRVSLDFQKMSRLGVSLSQVINTLAGNNINIPGGDVESGMLSFNIKSSGSFENLEEIRNTAIQSNGEFIVYLRDFATVEQSYEDLRWKARFNGKKSIFVLVTQKRGSNILQLSEKLRATGEEMVKELPRGIDLETAFEQAPAVKARIQDFIVNLVQGIALVGLIILFFLGWRPSLIIMTVIPLSILIALGVLGIIGYALQQISIAALVIALGLLVDNGIVVIENILRFRQEGHSRISAAAEGTREVGYAIISSSITTVLAFAPLAMLNSGPGEFLRTLPLTVILVLTASLLLALTFTPILASQLLPQKMKNKPPFLIRMIDTGIIRFYRPALHFSLRRGWLVLLFSFILLGGAVSLFPAIGISFFPTADKPLLLVEIEAPYSSNIERTDSAVRYVESLLDTMDFVHSYASNSGHGNPQVYYNRIPEEYKKYHGQVLINFKNWDPRRFYQSMGQLRKSFKKYTDAGITFRELKNGAPFEAPIEILVLGKNIDTLKRLAQVVEGIIQKTPRTLDVKNPLAISKTDLKVNIDREKAAFYQVSIPSIDQSVRASLNGLEIDQVTMDDDEEYPLIVRMPFDQKPSVNDYDKVYVTANTGAQIPLRQLAELEFEAVTAELAHYNTVRSIAVTANVNDAEATKDITEEILPQIDAIDWPKGYTYYVGGEYETQQESFGDLGALLIVAMLGIFAVLVLQFRSILQPLVIFSAIPLAVTGSFIALYLTGWSFSFFAFVGFISLIGIVVNNSIILVDYTNQLIGEGRKKAEAIRFAAERRFTPIVLTTMTTILGLVPLTFAATNLWSPLGWTIIGGMISSTFLTLFVVPILYQWFTRENRELKD